MTRPLASASARAPSAVDRVPLAALSLATLALGTWLGMAHFLPGRIDLKGPVTTALPLAHARLEAAVLDSLNGYDKARAQGDAATARDRLSEARNGLTALLATSPARPMLWAQLAEVEQRLGAPFMRVEALLRHSQAMGAMEFPAIIRRIELALRIWPALSAEARARADQDLATLLSMRTKHRALVFLVQTAAWLPSDRMAIAAAAVERHAPASRKNFESYRKSPPKEIMLP